MQEGTLGLNELQMCHMWRFRSSQRLMWYWPWHEWKRKTPTRNQTCLECSQSYASLRVPGPSWQSWCRGKKEKESGYCRSRSQEGGYKIPGDDEETRVNSPDARRTCPEENKYSTIWSGRWRRRLNERRESWGSRKKLKKMSPVNF